MFVFVVDCGTIASGLYKEETSLPFISFPAAESIALIAKFRAFCLAAITLGESHGCTKYFFSSFANSVGDILAPDSLRRTAVIKSFFRASRVF